MTSAEYAALEGYMKSCASKDDPAHDAEHVYRVLFTSLHIARTLDQEVDLDVLIASCLLHDIGRKRQMENPALCHAAVGGELAYAYLRDRGRPEEFAAHVRQCVQSHRFRGDNRPRTIEAKILFDADKLDVSGVLGIARTLLYQGETGCPLYAAVDGGIDPGLEKTAPESFFREYHCKLSRLYDGFYTEEARRIAHTRRRSAEKFYESLEREILESRRFQDCLEGILR